VSPSVSFQPEAILARNLLGADACGGAQIQLLRNERLQLLRDIARKRLAPEIVGDIEVGLVERQRLDERVQDRRIAITCCETAR